MAAPRLLARARLAAPAGPSRLAARASSTAAAPAAFEPALAPGVDEAYDIALAYLAEQNAAARAHAEQLKAAAGPTPTPEAYARAARAEVAAWVNDPATRRAFRASGGSGAGEMELAVMRHLAERAWRKDGELDLLMQRVFQLGVVPDLLPDHVPAAAIRLSGAQGAVEAGSVLAADALATPLQLTLQPFHHPSTPTEATPVPTALYTLLVVDPDSPNHETQSFSQRLHYAKADIPLSVGTGALDLFSAPGTEQLAYEPPAPPRGSGKHRYVFVVVRQGESANTAAPPASRDDFDLRAFLAERGLTSADVVATTLVRAEWTPEAAAHIDSTYLAHRGGPAPVYGKPPKALRYGYPLSAKAERREAVREAAYEGVLAELQAMQSGLLPEDEPHAPQQQ